MSAAPEPPSVLVVDAANVVGSRPDGWWRDRAAAAGRLHASLHAADPAYHEVVLVLEGEARAAVPVGVIGRVRTVHAPRDGDAAVLAEARRAADRGRRVDVVSADRALRARAEAVGAAVLGPSWLLDRLDGGNWTGRTGA